MYNDIEKELVFTENPENEIWQTILQFSYEANIKKYLGEHQLPINDDLVNNISGSILQAFEYYKASQNVDLQISPLLLYYGTTNLLYGITNLMTGTINDIHHHGMSIISPEKSNFLSNTEIRFENSNKGGIHVFSRVLGISYDLTHYGSWTLKEFLSSIPEIRQDYLKCYNASSSNTIPLLKFITPEGQLEKIEIKNIDTNLIFDELKMVLSFEKNYLRPTYSQDGNYLLLRKKLSGKSISVTSYSGQEFLQVGHLKNGNIINLPQMLYMYIALFALGSLCRYKPEIWNPFVKNDITGEKLLIKKFLQYSYRLIPNFVLNHIYGKTIIYSGEKYVPVDTIKLVGEHTVKEMINKQLYELQEAQRRMK